MANKLDKTNDGKFKNNIIIDEAEFIFLSSNISFDFMNKS